MYPKQEKVDVMEICGVNEQENHKSTGFDAPGTTVMTSTDDQRGIWEIDVRAQQQNLLHEMNDPSMFYNDQFPQIPDFPCMSSSSSSSSNPAPAKPISSATTTSSASSGSSSTSSAASWAVLKSEYVTEEEEAEGEDHLEELRINRRKRSHREEPVPVMTTAPAVEAVLLFLPTVVVSLPKNETTNFRPLQELKKLNRIRNHLKKINKQPVKTIHEPPLERPKGDNSTDETIESFQLWLQSNDPCPEGTIPIRRTTENDILRASSLKRFGRKNIRGVRRDTSSGGHETIIGGAADTTTVALTWTLALLVNHPEVLKKAQEEIETHVGRERVVEESDLKNLVYLSALIKESLRLYPPGAIIAPHQTIEDCIVAGYKVKKGTRLMVNLWNIQRDPAFWSQPEEYIPERFLTEQKEMDVWGQSYEFFPFSSGRRTCPGISLAIQSMQLTLATLLQGFEIESPTGGPLDMSEHFPGMITSKATPLGVLISPRLAPEFYL